MKRLTSLKKTVLIVSLLSCVLCGAGAAEARPALAALKSLTAEICVVTWLAEGRPAGVSLRVEIDCSRLLWPRRLYRLPLRPITHQWVLLLQETPAASITIRPAMPKNRLSYQRNSPPIAGHPHPGSGNPGRRSAVSGRRSYFQGGSDV